MDRAESAASSGRSANRNPSRPPEPSDTKGQHHRRRAESPTSDCLSLKSYWSMDKPPDLSDEAGPSGTKGQHHRQRAESPTSDCLSLKSDRSKGIPPDLSDEAGPSGTNRHPSKITLKTTSLVVRRLFNDIDLQVQAGSRVSLYFHVSPPGAPRPQ
ncbi:uncharacterized protein PAE49_019546 [Odontesthes bonariensis]|uniref:uncharacterized protein LOC142398689 n=1 Tax=Odontesthes bonariensis TaxID=219752 RepID=UPI003F58CD17